MSRSLWYDRPKKTSVTYVMENDNAIVCVKWRILRQKYQISRFKGIYSPAKNLTDHTTMRIGTLLMGEKKRSVDTLISSYIARSGQQNVFMSLNIFYWRPLLLPPPLSLLPSLLPPTVSAHVEARTIGTDTLWLESAPLHQPIQRFLWLKHRCLLDRLCRCFVSSG